MKPPPPKKKVPEARPQGPSSECLEQLPKKLGTPPPAAIAGESAPVEIYYDHNSLVFWFKDRAGEFTRMSESAIRQHLNIAGFDNSRSRGLASQIDEMVAEIRLTKKIDYVGRLAGYPIGYWQIYGRRLLITREARLAEPSHSDNTKIVDFIVRLLGKEQADVVFAWVKLAIAARRAALTRLIQEKPPNFRAGQYLGVAGDPDHGKTVLSRILVWTISSLDEMKGDLSQFHKGQTTFNADGAKHETHVIDDEGGSDSPTGRREMLESIKKGVGQQEKRVHGKGQEGETLELFNRTIILLNRGIADLRILPEMDDGISEKIHLLKTIARAVDCDTCDIDAFNQYFDDLRAAVPDFIGFLDQFEIPSELVGGRFGMLHYHNPELLADLSELSSTTGLWELLDDFWFEHIWRDGKFVGTTGSLYSALIDTADFGPKARLLGFAKTAAIFGKIVHSAADQEARKPQSQRRIARLGRSHGSAMQFEFTKFNVAHSDNVEV